MTEHEGNTGKVRLVVREELETKVNGSLDRIEKAQRWLKAILFFISVIGAGAGGVMYWFSSIAKKSEVAEVRSSVQVLGAKVDTIGEAIGELSKKMDEGKKHGR